MALTTFHFIAQVPATPEYLEPLGQLVAHALKYIGVAGAEATAAASDLMTKVGNSLPARKSGSIEVRFEKDAERLEVAITVDGAVHRLVRQSPA